MYIYMYTWIWICVCICVCIYTHILLIMLKWYLKQKEYINCICHYIPHPREKSVAQVGSEWMFVNQHINKSEVISDKSAG